MDIPICDFVREYTKKEYVRLHMPGHKGKGFLGVENFDITEINGADTLYEAKGVIAKSEENASRIFDTRKTFYCTGGSSQALKAMLYLAKVKSENKSDVIVTTRAAHQSFYSACTLLNLMPCFIEQNEHNVLYNEVISAKKLDETLNSLKKPPLAVFVTSLDYLGTVQNIPQLSKVCKKHNTVLLADNAHGAYLRFTNEHPINLGADLCCDSAHKTLPALTGAAYLHVGKNAKFEYENIAKKALLLFGSTSPSYLILQSLDYLNKILADNYEEKLLVCIEKIKALKANLKSIGFDVLKTDELKLVINANKIGYTGEELAQLLRNCNIESEFCDNTFTVFMFTTQNDSSEFKKLLLAFKSIEQKKQIGQNLVFEREKSHFAMSPREALLSRCKRVEVENAIGKICADVCFSCPPALPIVVSGEVISENIVKKLKYYNVTHIDIIEE